MCDTCLWACCSHLHTSFFFGLRRKKYIQNTSELECVLHADDDTGVKITQPYSLCMRALPPHVLIGLRHISKLPSASLECVSFTHESEVVSTFTERHYVSARCMCLLCRAEWRKWEGVRKKGSEPEEWEQNRSEEQRQENVFGVNCVTMCTTQFKINEPTVTSFITA